jgi:phage baseplate assembly protein W
MTQVDFPYRYDGRGRTADTGSDDHVRDLVEQVLFTVPGERVNRPDFGSGLLQLTFAPLSDELAAATQALVQGALQQWLGDVIAVDRVAVTRDDATLDVIVEYTVVRTGERRADRFTAPGAAP